MIKLIVSDLDGTLLDSNKQLPTGFWQLEEALHNRGIRFCVASGRQYFTIEEQFAPIKGRLTIIAENGSLVMHNDKVLHTCYIPWEEAIKLIVKGRTIPGVQVVVCGEQSAYMDNPDPIIIAEVQKYYTRIQYIDDVFHVNDNILKVTMFDFVDAENNSLKQFNGFQGPFKFAVAGKLWLDITHQEAHKGNALERLQKQWGIKPEETMAFGDYLNDLEMLDRATYSYAMKSGHPQVLARAAYITDHDNNHGGVLEVISKYCLNGSP